MDGEHTARPPYFIHFGRGLETETQLVIDSSCVPVSAPLMTRPDSIHATAAASTTPGSRDKLETKGETIA
jgi:hypothetical protein